MLACIINLLGICLIQLFVGRIPSLLRYSLASLAALLLEEGVFPSILDKVDATKVKNYYKES